MNLYRSFIVCVSWLLLRPAAVFKSFLNGAKLFFHLLLLIIPPPKLEEAVELEDPSEFTLYSES